MTYWLSLASVTSQQQLAAVRVRRLPVIRVSTPAPSTVNENELTLGSRVNTEQTEETLAPPAGSCSAGPARGAAATLKGRSTRFNDIR